MSILPNDNNSDSDQELKINKDYAEKYNNWRQKEELNKLKTKYGEHIVHATESDSSNDSSSSEDDDDENVNNVQFDKEFYKTLACLKKKDPRIYDEKIKFFNNIDKSEIAEVAEIEGKRKNELKKEKTLFLRDYERNIVVERDGKFSSSEDEDNAKQKAKTKTSTYVEEQQKLKNSFICALNDKDEDDDTELLKIKQKTENEKYKEEESYKEWLKGQKIEIDSQEQEELKSLHDFWTNPNLNTNEKFLRDYILYNKYMDIESSNKELGYDEIAHDSDENLSEDEKNIEKQEEFEYKYNFRFEEPDQEFIKRYPRTMENSMRRKDTRRAQKRTEVKQRKEKEKQQKREELKQLKALKRKEIEEKIEKLKEIIGNNDMRFDDVDFDADFDPNEHDKKMKELFDEEYYANTEDNEKPTFPEIDEELDIETTWDNYDPTTDKIETEDAICEEPHCEDPDFIMDADYGQTPTLQSEIIENTKKRKRKRRSKFATLIAKEKPKFDPEQFPSYQEYFDQYYSLDYEDMIGDLPCRFKYRKVVPNDYGLSVKEILTADDKDLNKWCSLKTALQHKPEYIEMRDVRSYKQKAANEALKKKILKSLYTEPQEKEEGTCADESVENIQQRDDTKRKKKRKQNKKKNQASKSFVDTQQEKKTEEKFLSNKIKNGKRKSNNKIVDPIISLNAERLKTYGINAKKFKNKLKYGNKKF